MRNKNFRKFCEYLLQREDALMKFFDKFARKPEQFLDFHQIFKKFSRQRGQ